ncbi:MAG: hypothetical protein PHN44_00520 [Candidatus Marinimicrobia bacterium]|nr:hypothetical protein [Candidatus Neomarinimicrobiota bacterium]MDD5539151.1 hypothetical protein [Candidatus Neomarinimicrobiota bacterium]
MKIRVDKLRENFHLIQPVISKKTTIPITRSVLLKDGKMTGTNLEETVILDLPEADTTCLLPFDLVSAILELIPGTSEITIESTKKTVTLTWANGKAAYPTDDPLDFPEVNKFDAPVIVGEVDGDLLVNTISPMVKYAASEDERPVLKAVHLYLGEKTVAAAGDGFRAVYQTLPMSFGEKGTISLGLNTVKILEHLWKKALHPVPVTRTFIEAITSKRELAISVSDEKGVHSWVGFKFGRVKIIAQLVAGTPPDFALVIPRPTNKLSVISSNLKLAAMRTKDIANAASGIVRLKWTENEMEVYAKTEEIGDILATIPIDAPDGPGKIAVNVKYLLEYLNGKDGIIKMGTTSHDSPMLLEYSNSPLTVIMPMLVQWEK